VQITPERFVLVALVVVVAVLAYFQVQELRLPAQSTQYGPVLGSEQQRDMNRRIDCLAHDYWPPQRC